VYNKKAAPVKMPHLSIFGGVYIAHRAHQLHKINKIREISLEYSRGEHIPAERPSAQLPSRLPHENRTTIDFLGTELANSGTNYKRLRLKLLGMTYHEYIQSTHWRKFRKRYIKGLKSNQCEVYNCRNRAVLLHHRTYTRLGEEHRDDVFFICNSCHDQVHEYIRRKRRHNKKQQNRHDALGEPEKFTRLPRSGHRQKMYLPWGGLFDCRFKADTKSKAQGSNAQSTR